MTTTSARKGRPALRRGSVRLLAIVLTIAVIAALGVFLVLRVRSGPIEGDEGLSVRIPVRAGERGVMWGNLELYNRSGSAIVLDRVSVVPGDGDLPLLTEPYVWAADRVEIAQNRSLIAWQIPVPPAWTAVPRHAVAGYRIEPTADDGIGPEIVIEPAVPATAATISAIRVDYHVGLMTYSRTFDNAITVCPPSDLDLCPSAR